MHRREFLGQSATAAAGLGSFPAALSAIERVIVPGGIERRALGRTGEALSATALGGIVLNGRTPEYAARLVRDAFEAGITHFDVAPLSVAEAEAMQAKGQGLHRSSGRRTRGSPRPPPIPSC